MKSFWLSASLVLTVSIAALVFLPRRAAPVALVVPRGEPISGESSSASAGTEEIPNPAAKPKHPKPASVQRRMIQAQVVLEQQHTLDSSGTLGTSADWANGKSATMTNVETADVHYPGYATVAFSTLAGYEYPLESELIVTTPTNWSPIPASVKALDGRKAAIEGFLLPVRMDKDGLAVEFLLMRNQSMCCYGVPPKITEWISVEAKGKGAKPVMDQPVVVLGTLQVGEVREGGALAGIYRMDADKIIGP